MTPDEELGLAAVSLLATEALVLLEQSSPSAAAAVVGRTGALPPERDVATLAVVAGGPRLAAVVARVRAYADRLAR